ncbi:MAG: IS4 family transposase [Ignavibacteria bacterium]|nr:IS4 family transposase [Ignavibacteria bacterium]
MKANSENKNKGNESFIEQKLNKISLEKLSKESGFSKRKAKKIRAKDFLSGFFMMAHSRESHSYRNWAIKIGWLIKERVSKQALCKKMRQTQITFLNKVLSSLIEDTLEVKSNDWHKEKPKMFKNIIIEDSTCIQLNDKLKESYPGNGYQNNNNKTAILKIQAAYNITRQKFIRFDITSFRDNDQGYSPKIVGILKRGDLVIRDLGYFVLNVFQKLNKEGIFFISRMKRGVNIFSREEEIVIDLAKMLKKRGKLDIEVFLGEKEKLPIRLIALPVEEKTANERRRKAKTNRDQRHPPNKECLYLLGWELFITNVEKEILSPTDIAALYFIRWRIEIIFKSWKSYFKIIAVPKDANKIRVESYIYCMLIFITLFQVHFYNYYLARTSKKEISLLRLMQFITTNIDFFFMNALRDKFISESFLMGQINYYCLYEYRADRVNFHQKLLKLS